MGALPTLPPAGQFPDVVGRGFASRWAGAGGGASPWAGVEAAAKTSPSDDGGGEALYVVTRWLAFLLRKPFAREDIFLEELAAGGTVSMGVHFDPF